MATMNILRLHAARLTGLILAVCLGIAVFIPARAGTFFVTETSDTTNANSLRSAVIAANAVGGDNVIVLTNGVYQLARSGTREEAAVSGDLDIANGSITIIGSSWPRVVINAAGLGDRLFEVLPHARLTLSGLVLTGGTAPGGGYSFQPGESGGAILNRGTLVLEDCVISNNAAGPGNYLMGNGGGTSGGDGGGIANSGVLIMTSCTITENLAGGGADGAGGGVGGGIFNSGYCILTSCTLSNNSTGSGGQPEGNAFGFAGSGGGGGGILNSGTAILADCTLSENATGQGGTGAQPGIVGPFGAPGGWGGAGGSGGGANNSSQMWLVRCAVSRNSCGNGGDGGQGVGRFGSGGGAGPGGSGAGIYNTGRLNLNTCTIGGNFSGAGGNGGVGFSGGGAAGAMGGAGGGICNEGSVDLIACTIASNSTGGGGDGGSADDFAAAVPGASGGPGGSGGGIFSKNGTSTIALRNSILALNSTGIGGVGGTNLSGATGATGPQGDGFDGYGDFLSLGYNLFGQIGGIHLITNVAKGDLVGTSSNPINPRLSASQMNGSSTSFFALLPSSPAIDAGDDALLQPPENATTDQRGRPRKSGKRVDIGAVEYDGTLNGVALPPRLTDMAMSSGSLQSWFNGAPGFDYSIWVSTDLRNWTKLGSAEEMERGWFFFQDSDALSHAMRFFQVRHP